jgi:chromosome segregation ATPase
LNRTLRQVEEYNEVMKGEIGATRRNTYNVEEAVKILEQAKKKQDMLIDSMNEEIKRLNEQKTLIQAQLISQREETDAARETLKQANGEIKQVVIAKKNLLEDWKKSLQAMQTRDKALQSMRDLIKEKQENIVRIESEINGVKKETKAEHDTALRLLDMKAKFEQEQAFLEAKLDEIKGQKKRLEEQHKMLKQSTNNTQDEIKKMNLEKSNVEDAMNTLQKQIMNYHNKIKDLRDQIMNHASQQKTIEKSSANLIKQTKGKYQQISDKEIETEDILNEISRVKIDVLNAEQQNEILEAKLKQLKDEQSEKDREVSKFEKQIKEKHVKIQKR